MKQAKRKLYCVGIQKERKERRKKKEELQELEGEQNQFPLKSKIIS